jgi:hypothetical protein
MREAARLDDVFERERGRAGELRLVSRRERMSHNS